MGPGRHLASRDSLADRIPPLAHKHVSTVTSIGISSALSVTLAASLARCTARAAIGPQPDATQPHVDDLVDLPGAPHGSVAAVWPKLSQKRLRVRFGAEPTTGWCPRTTPGLAPWPSSGPVTWGSGRPPPSEVNSRDDGERASRALSRYRGVVRDLAADVSFNYVTAKQVTSCSLSDGLTGRRLYPMNTDANPSPDGRSLVELETTPAEGGGPSDLAVALAASASIGRRTRSAGGAEEERWRCRLKRLLGPC